MAVWHTKESLVTYGDVCLSFFSEEHQYTHAHGSVWGPMQYLGAHGSVWGGCLSGGPMAVSGGPMAVSGGPWQCLGS